MTLRAFATCPRGMEPLLAAEVRAQGGTDLRSPVGGVEFSATLPVLYRVCLWSRVASRVLVTIGQADVGGERQLYEAARAIDWPAQFSLGARFAVRFSGSSAGVTNTQYGARRVKDGIVDRFREQTGERPSVDTRAPDIAIHARLRRGRLSLSLDLCGASLDRRGYRRAGGPAPLRENLAAAILYRAGWGAQGGPRVVLDPMCGTGTLPIEAALMALDIAPGLLRAQWGFDAWRAHQPEIWERVRARARAASHGPPAGAPVAIGFDERSAAVRAARENAAVAGVADWIRFEQRPLAALARPLGIPAADPVLVAVNPPYGQRMGDASSLAHLYRDLGERVRRGFGGDRLAVFTGAPGLGSALGLRARKRYRLWNGPIASELLLFDIHEPASGARGPVRASARAAPAASAELPAGARMLANRLRKNRRRLEAWRVREAIECYRLYDADIPEYAVAVDVYRDWVHVAEYAPPPTVEPALAARRMVDVSLAIPAVLGVAPARVVVKRRSRQRGNRQYHKRPLTERWLEIREGEACLLVNLTAYLDTGLFLDHRRTRLRIAQLAAGRRFLNLFCYTASASIHAALGGALDTTSVDLSRTYLNWARRNLELNGLGRERHQLVRADALAWLRACKDTYGLIFLDPPTFSNSKRTDLDFDVQRDHAELIRAALARLEPRGTIIFSTNRRRFGLDPGLEGEVRAQDVTRQSLDRDFPWPAQGPPAHRCWEISAR